MLSGRNAIYPCLYLGVMNSNPPLEFGILIFFAAVKTEPCRTMIRAEEGMDRLHGCTIPTQRVSKLRQND